MKVLWIWGGILAVMAPLIYLLGCVSGVLNDTLSIGGLGVLLVGDSPAAIVLLTFSFSCLINAVTVFVLGFCMKKNK